MAPVTVGIVGCGLIASEKHIPSYRAAGDAVELRAVCDLNEELALETARENDVPAAYGDTSEMLATEDLDMVDICVPPQVHDVVALEAIDAGCHVIMEKPMALSTDACDEMIEAATDAGVKISAIHNDLFHPPFRRARELVADGAVGQFTGMRIHLATPRSHMLDQSDHWYHDLPGGVIGETGPHVAYMSLAFLEDVVDVAVFAHSVMDREWAPFDEFHLVLEGDDAVSSATLSYTTDYWAATVDILGTEAMLELDLQNMSVVRHSLSDLEPTSIGVNSLKTISQRGRDLTKTTVDVLRDEHRIGTEYVLQSFVEAIQHDTAPPVTPQEARQTVETMERVVGEYHRQYDD